MTLPDGVIKARKAILRDTDNSLREIAKKLITDDIEIVKMWEALQRRDTNPDQYWHWVNGFLSAVNDANTLPAYHYLNKQSRKDLITRINELAGEFARVLKVNELDGQLIFLDGKMFNGFHLFEDFGESNQAQINVAGVEKLAVSWIIEAIATRAIEKIQNEPQEGKKSKNVRAVRFVRALAKRNMLWFNEPLLAVLATAANALHDTEYTEADISKLLNR
ncbi:MAG TPA: hypothetical protein VIE65_03475 [Methylobacter sp.]